MVKRALPCLNQLPSGLAGGLMDARSTNDSPEQLQRNKRKHNDVPNNVTNSAMS